VAKEPQCSSPRTLSSSPYAKFSQSLCALHLRSVLALSFPTKKVMKVSQLCSSESRSLPWTRMPPNARTAPLDRQLLHCMLQGRSPPSLSQTLSDGEARKARSPPLLPLSLHHRMGVGHTIVLAWHERDMYSPCPSPFLSFVPCDPACPSSSFPLAGQPLNPRGKPRKPARHQVMLQK
jgi:hypothetical protein